MRVVRGIIFGPQDDVSLLLELACTHHYKSHNALLVRFLRAGIALLQKMAE